ncbi:MAG: translation initiation factor IF-3 [Elusimicrobia bacterium]|nr:translation initiation factor IF-3 [Elusimicrobiota bacterium]
MAQHKYGPRKNHQINASPVRLIDNDGTMVGVKTIQEAVSLAKVRGLDLVEIAPQAKPPVCKVLDYSKYLYELDKKEREARKKQKGGSMKEIQLGCKIASHDLETKLKHAEEFLSKSNKVRVTVVFFGRENKHRDIGRALLESVKVRLGKIAGSDSISTAGNRMSLTFMPKEQ